MQAQQLQMTQSARLLLVHTQHLQMTQPRLLSSFLAGHTLALAKLWTLFVWPHRRSFCSCEFKNVRYTTYNIYLQHFNDVQANL